MGGAQPGGPIAVASDSRSITPWLLTLSTAPVPVVVDLLVYARDGCQPVDHRAKVRIVASWVHRFDGDLDEAGGGESR
jgi:hypothetical protein